MRLSGGVAILGEGPDSRDAEPREQTDHASEHGEIAGTDAGPVQDDTTSETPC